MVAQGIPEETGYILFLFAATILLVVLFAWALNLRALGATGTVPVLIFMVVALPPLAYALHLANQRENW